MRCDEVREILPGYVDADLHPVGEVEVHLAGCAECSVILASYRDTIARLAALPHGDPAPPSGLVARIVAEIPEPSLVDRVRGSVRERPMAYAAGVGVAALAAAAVVIAVRRQRAGEVAAAATA
jgi:anti-sigma factor RsiW